MENRLTLILRKKDIIRVDNEFFIRKRKII